MIRSIIPPLLMILALLLLGKMMYAAIPSSTALVVLAPIPFQNDSVLTCETIIDTLHLSSTTPVDISEISFSGPDGTSFQLVGPSTRSLPKDSLVRIICTPTHAGILTANIHLVTKDGTITNVPIQLDVLFAPLLLSQSSFFIGDSISICSSRSDSLVLFSPCPLNLQSINVVGTDSSSFKIIVTGSISAPDDSTITIICTPLHSGALSAKVRILLPDGSAKDISVSLFVIDEPSLIIESTPLVICDTIGGNVRLRLVFHQKSVPSSTEFTIHYDPSSLLYREVVDSKGTDQTIDIPNGSSARIRFNTSADSVLYAIFSFFPGDSSCTTVYLDSINLFNSSAQCVHIEPGSLSSQICSSTGCGRSYLSSFARHARVQRYWIVPNPSVGEAILHSDMPLEFAELCVSNTLGMTCFTAKRTIGDQIEYPLHFESLAPGSYFLHVNGQESVIPLIISK